MVNLIKSTGASWFTIHKGLFKNRPFVGWAHAICQILQKETTNLLTHLTCQGSSSARRWLNFRARLYNELLINMFLCLELQYAQVKVKKKNSLFPDPQSFYLENKHLSSEHSDCVEVPFTDIWSIVIWSFSGPRAVRMPRRCLRWPGLRAPRRHSGKGLGGATVWLTLGENVKLKTASF